MSEITRLSRNHHPLPGWDLQLRSSYIFDLLQRDIVSLILNYLDPKEDIVARSVSKDFYGVSIYKIQLFLGCLCTQIQRLDPSGYQEKWKKLLTILSNETFLRKTPPLLLVSLFRERVFVNMPSGTVSTLQTKFLSIHTMEYFLFPNAFKMAFQSEESKPSLEGLALRSASMGYRRVLRVLHISGQNLKGVTQYGEGPPHRAAAAGQIKILEMLINLGIPINGCDCTGKNAAHHAAAAGQIKVLEQLNMLGVNLAATDCHGRTPMHLAAMEGQDEVIPVLDTLGLDLNPQDRIGYTPMHLAAMNGHDDAIRVFDELGADLGVQGHLGKTLMHFAAIKGHVNTIIVLHSLGVALHDQDFFRNTPRDHAMKNGQWEAVKVLDALDVSVMTASLSEA